MTKPTIMDVFSSEEAMCRAFWCSIMYYTNSGYIEKGRIFHVPNGQRAGSSTMARMIAGKKDKAMGATSGVWDYCVQGVGYLEAKIYKAHYPENDSHRPKITKTYLSPSQKVFRENTLKFWPECKFEVFRTPDEGIAILEEWNVIK